MALPRLLLRVIDPAQVYFDRHRSDLEPGRHLGHPQAAIYGPGVSGESRAASLYEKATLAQDAVRHRDDHEAAIADSKRRWAGQLQQAAHELLTTGAAELHLGDRTVAARMIKFWRGDHLLQTATSGPNGNGESLSRISRNAGRGPTDVVIEYLARASTKG